MKYKRFALILYGLFLIGVSVGYVLGFYVHKYLNYNYLFYVSAIIMGIGSYLLIYGSLFVKDSKE